MLLLTTLTIFKHKHTHRHTHRHPHTHTHNAVTPPPSHPATQSEGGPGLHGGLEGAGAGGDVREPRGPAEGVPRHRPEQVAAGPLPRPSGGGGQMRGGGGGVSTPGTPGWGPGGHPTQKHPQNPPALQKHSNTRTHARTWQCGHARRSAAAGSTDQRPRGCLMDWAWGGGGGWILGGPGGIRWVGEHRGGGASSQTATQPKGKSFGLWTLLYKYVIRPQNKPAAD